MALRRTITAVKLGLVGAVAVAVVVSLVSQRGHLKSSTLSNPVAHPERIHVTRGTTVAQSVSVTKVAQEMPFPVLKPPTNRFPIESITAAKGRGAPSVQFVMGQLFHGRGLMIEEQDHKVTISGSPNGEKTTPLAGYKATVARWINAANIPIALASIYTGTATYTVTGTHVSLSLVESTLVTMLQHQR